MARKQNTSAGIGVLVLLGGILYLFTNKIFLIILGIIVLIAVITIIIYVRKKHSIDEVMPQNDGEGSIYAVFEDESTRELVKYNINKYPLDIPAYLSEALEAEVNEDFLKARVAYMQSIEILKRCSKKDFNTYIGSLQKMYDDFVLRDPYYKRLMAPLLQIIAKNNGILQSEITKHFQRSDWGALKYYNRPPLKDDIYYALYFADRFGDIIRVKKGRSYLLYLPGTEPNQLEFTNKEE